MHIPHPVDSAAYWPVGTIQKAYGLRGHVLVSLANEYQSLPTFTTLFLYLHATYVPYLVASWQARDKHALIKFSHITTRTQASKLRDQALFAAQQCTTLQVRQRSNLLINYMVEDLNKGMLGYVTCVHQRSLQPFLAITHQGRELLIPFHPTFVRQVNATKKNIQVDLPEHYITVLLGS